MAQRFNDFWMAQATSEMEGSSPTPASGVNSGLGNQKRLSRHQISASARGVQRRLAVDTRLHIRVCTRQKKAQHSGHITVSGGIIQFYIHCNNLKLARDCTQEGDGTVRACIERRVAVDCDCFRLMVESVFGGGRAVRGTCTPASFRPARTFLTSIFAHLYISPVSSLQIVLHPAEDICLTNKENSSLLLPTIALSFFLLLTFDASLR